MKNLLKFLGFGKRRSWQELVGLRPHMIDEAGADGGYGEGCAYSIKNRIAVVDISGLLVNDEKWWEDFGCATYDRIGEDVMNAADDPNCDGILLCINSPGGETDNAFETAAKIVAASKKKPCWAVAETSAFSAAYLLASSAARIYVPPFTGGVGSIGVYMTHLDWSGMLEQAGIQTTIIEAGKGKTDGHPYKPLGAAAKQRLQASIDRLYGLFVDHVSLQRGIPAGTIRELGAEIFPGSMAIDAGLADKMGDKDSVLEEMRAFLDSRLSIPASVPTVAITLGEKSCAELLSGNAISISPDTPPESTDASGITVEALSLPSQPAIVDSAEDDDPVVAAREAAENAARIRSLCSLHGLTDADAETFIQARRTHTEVAAELIERRASASDEHEIVSQLQPHTAATAGATSIDETAIVKAAEKLARRNTKGR